MKNLVLQNLKSNKAYSFLEIARINKINPNFNSQLSKALFSLLDQGLIVKNNDGNFIKVNEIKKIQGIFKQSNRNFAFIETADEQSYFVAKAHFNGAINSFEVEAIVYESPFEKDKKYAVVKKILKNTHPEIIGFIKISNGIKYFNAFEESFRSYKFFVDQNIDVEEDDVILVVVEKIVDQKIYVNFVKKVSTLKSNFYQIDIVLEKSKTIIDFPEDVLDEFALIEDHVIEKDYQNRKDLRDKLIITIDGEDTKDFDDAIYVEKNKDHFLLSVHIADVAHYVKENSAIDKEALRRATSIYLPHMVIPMLPEKLSNGICSLNPGVDRLVMSIDIFIDFQGNTIKTELYEGIINSKHRLTYNQVNDFYNNKIKLDPNLEKMLNDSLELSKILENYKKDEGYINLEIEESKVILDKEGKTVGIKVIQRGLSEVLIENFMVRANEAVAWKMNKLKLPSIYRVHDNPSIESLVLFEKTLKTLGIDFDTPKITSPKAFSDSFEKIKQNYQIDNFVKLMVLRTMEKAIYSDKNIGHFGLASSYYSHFTSPIRRYPDLQLHRLIKQMVFDKSNLKEKKNHFSLILSDVSVQSSKKEVEAVSIERQINDIKKAEYYESKIGKSLKAQIVSILSFGMFVEFEDKVSGLIHISNLLGEDFQVSEDGLLISSNKTKYKLGQEIDVVVVKVDKNLGKVDVVLEKDYQEYLKKEQAFQAFKKNKFTQDKEKQNGKINYKK
ncbi:ribonuclease R [Mycoplasmopsis pulmonis]|uniref:ribonuclease R n=1 Tax=Mycoplasmopsis pulmonis TaxID=2107 RepID=UPI001004E3AB|nr:ribonuclease R [Mycoplasmopsis pulmonis]VEU68114.1 exoribonuclease II [Mycoplasmopsis pulmonis]